MTLYVVVVLVAFLFSSRWGAIKEVLTGGSQEKPNTTAGSAATTGSASGGTKPA